MERQFSNSSGRIAVSLKATDVGDDLLVTITGGKAHVGRGRGHKRGRWRRSSVVTGPGTQEDPGRQGGPRKSSQKS